ncbi:mobilization protein, partial [Bacteroides thetaiotaomicron]
MGATSIHVQAVKPGSEIHNFREKELDYVRPELSHLNKAGLEIASPIAVGQKMQAKAAPIREGVIVIKQE